MAAQRKSIKGPHQEAPRDDDIEDTDASDGNGQEEGKKKGKKKQRVKTPDWTVDVFEKDEKVFDLSVFFARVFYSPSLQTIRVIKTILELKHISEEDPSTASKLNEMAATIRCKTCKGWIVMDFDTAVSALPDCKIPSI